MEVKFDNGTKYETNTENTIISFSSNERYKYYIFIIVENNSNIICI